MEFPVGRPPKRGIKMQINNKEYTPEENPIIIKCKAHQLEPKWKMQG